MFTSRTLVNKCGDGKCVRQTWYSYQLFGFPLSMMYTLKYGESPNINAVGAAINTILQHFYSLEFENRYVSANIIRKRFSEKPIVAFSNSTVFQYSY